MQPELKPGEGPIGVICAPTRELVLQIHTETKRFGKPFGLRTCAVYGGGNKYEQQLQLRDGCDVVVATPGRLIDFIKSKATNMRRASFLVLDEADRMFALGFEAQVHSIVGQIRPDRQTMLFSATFQRRVERLARAALTDPIRVVIGTVGEVGWLCCWRAVEPGGPQGFLFSGERGRDADGGDCPRPSSKVDMAAGPAAGLSFR